MIQEIMQFVSRNMLLSLVWIALLVAVVVMTFKGLFSKSKVIARSQAITLINKEEAVVVDLRTREDFRKGHIIDSINLTPSEIKDNNLGELEKHKQKPVIIVSASGMESGKPAEQLTQYGFEKVFVLKEGIAGWAGENLPLARGKK
ncbi:MULTISPECIES: rhodanese-like domain-containing protein [Providencia]|uniref:Rhodanese family sulfurtransferase n=1 Tax=Providencia heimbachae ATCC 35613 TaxID=1354272 RepID=A0A1B7JU56_9GAMM|nr:MULTISPECIES: rhodanese-like domain-containing protein [Providencia]MBP6123949.1 rhodanese-like domain-containing protein [Providencia sp.]MDD9340030.1 rhodanese-like domain-containing protein [Providencia heimbachae]NIH24464.1 rhodanese-like domain-containing protein [Providencia heimbachae]OAT51438.1 rhodanese family sulfurtransferase [Providencia heimbachae ATCC 35613]QCJ71851.1 rhodanese-like domain-containing protein [Providencia heimbachae]